MSDVTAYRASLIAAFDARATYESAKNSENTSMQNTLATMKKSVDHDAIASIMLAANVDATFINRAERSNARFNVYASEKVINVARACASAAQLNHYTRAILLTAQAFQNAELRMTHKDAISACSMSCKSDAKREKIIVKYMKHVAANTASTQSSSSINALQMFDVLRETRDESNAICYTLNTESDVTKALLAKLQ
ncbi:hypothetical protein SAMN05216548_11434 [Faunimonas pinastri]|uniref:Uncharacterized protein n=1 Tax=Faunimonas pinastri TaxID=1855383 RepID=A0A1H9MSR7_9HYPH|nr:hypothetical protein [Faunimonas pinastri]SER26744.1 hypothetical protein SAMN05216548_11434 [Faunimonas pinastri]